jgi:hypothetical protein
LPVQESTPSFTFQLVIGPAMPCQPARSLPLKSGLKSLSAADVETTPVASINISAFIAATLTPPQAGASVGG